MHEAERNFVRSVVKVDFVRVSQSMKGLQIAYMMNLYCAPNTTPLVPSHANGLLQLLLF